MKVPRFPWLKARAFITRLRGYNWQTTIRKLEGSSSAKERWEAAEELAKAPPKQEIIAALAEALGDPHPFVRWKAGEALLVLGTEEAFQALLESLQNHNPARRATAAEVLGEWGDERAVEPLCSALKSQDYMVRWSAAEALGKLKSPQALSYFLKAAEDEAWGVRRAVALGIGGLLKVTAIEETGFKVLESLSRDSHPVVRSAVARALGRVRHPETESLLINLLGDKDSQVQLEAIRALGQIGSERALLPLQELLQEGDEALEPVFSKTAQEAIRAIKRRLFLARLKPARGRTNEARGA